MNDSSNVFSKMKVKDVLKNTITFNEFKTSRFEMLKDWEFLTSKFPNQEFFNLEKENLKKKLDNLISDFEEHKGKKDDKMKNMLQKQKINCKKKSSVFNFMVLKSTNNPNRNLIGLDDQLISSFYKNID